MCRAWIPRMLCSTRDADIKLCTDSSITQPNQLRGTEIPYPIQNKLWTPPNTCFRTEDVDWKQCNECPDIENLEKIAMGSVTPRAADTKPCTDSPNTQSKQSSGTKTPTPGHTDYGIPYPMYPITCMSCNNYVGAQYKVCGLCDLRSTTTPVPTQSSSERGTEINPRRFPCDLTKRCSEGMMLEAITLLKHQIGEIQQNIIKEQRDQKTPTAERKDA